MGAPLPLLAPVPERVGTAASDLLISRAFFFLDLLARPAQGTPSPLLFLELDKIWTRSSLAQAARLLVRAPKEGGVPPAVPRWLLGGVSRDSEVPASRFWSFCSLRRDLFFGFRLEHHVTFSGGRASEGEHWGRRTQCEPRFSCSTSTLCLFREGSFCSARLAVEDPERQRYACWSGKERRGFFL